MKLFVDTLLPKRQIRYMMKLVAFEYDVQKLHFNNQAKRLDGSYNYANSSIFVNNKQKKKNMLCVFFHELAHHVAARQRKWWVSYHNGTKRNMTPLKQFEIENKVDVIAKSLWSKHVNVKSWGSYQFRYPKSKKAQLSVWLSNYNSN